MLHQKLPWFWWTKEPNMITQSFVQCVLDTSHSINSQHRNGAVTSDIQSVQSWRASTQYRCVWRQDLKMWRFLSEFRQILILVLDKQQNVYNGVSLFGLRDSLKNVVSSQFPWAYSDPQKLPVFMHFSLRKVLETVFWPDMRKVMSFPEHMERKQDMGHGIIVYRLLFD